MASADRIERAAMESVTVHDNRFLLDGEPFRVLAGATHYFRVVPEYRSDRLRKLRFMGLNTLETYVAWNLHESKPGEFDFDGRTLRVETTSIDRFALRESIPLLVSLDSLSTPVVRATPEAPYGSLLVDRKGISDAVLLER